MKHLKSKFDKHDLPNLPKAVFEGRIFTIVSEEEADRAVEYLLSQPILGLDTETRPSFKPGSGMNKVALLQVSSSDTCFLFRLNQMGMPPCIIRLLQDTTITKVGLSWHDDLMQLRRRQDFEPGTYVELQKLILTLGIKDLSLQKIYANLFGQKISKTQRLTNWEADVLTSGQQVYAATDAWACIQIYNEILRLQETNDYELEIIPDPEPLGAQESKEPKEAKKKSLTRDKSKGKKPRKQTAPKPETNTEGATEAATKPKRRYVHRKRKPKASTNPSEPTHQPKTE